MKTVFSNQSFVVLSIFYCYKNKMSNMKDTLKNTIIGKIYFFLFEMVLWSTIPFLATNHPSLQSWPSSKKISKYMVNSPVSRQVHECFHCNGIPFCFAMALRQGGVNEVIDPIVNNDMNEGGGKGFVLGKDGHK